MSYVVDMRRKLHQCPEIGFELPKTLAIIKGELEAFGIPYTEEFGKSSLVATVNDEKSHYTIGIRADTDALPILEKNTVPYKSKHKGQMHACGHDAHTAILLDVAKRLSEMKDQINCRVKLIFQAAEEYSTSGAEWMARDGVMEDIDCVVALHVDPKVPCGKIALTPGPQNAISSGFHLDFYGKSIHVAQQEKGVDAIAMAVKAYTAIEIMMSKELPASALRTFNVGAFHGGVTNNVICNHASLNCTVRAWEEETEAYIVKRIKGIIAAVAKESGGKATYTQNKYYPIVYNDPAVVEKMRPVANRVVGKDNVIDHIRTTEGEDFSYFLHKKPGLMFRLGVRNEEKDCKYLLHQDKFNLDEDALQIGSDMFVGFVLDNMNQ